VGVAQVDIVLNGSPTLQLGDVQEVFPSPRLGLLRRCRHGTGRVAQVWTMRGAPLRPPHRKVITRFATGRMALIRATVDQLGPAGLQHGLDRSDARSGSHYPDDGHIQTLC
jgi:hypothetical protein